MGDELLPYLNKELAYLHALADAQFRESNPQVATRLGMGPATIRDPHVKRLIEGVAYLNARIQCKLDDDFPELTHALLGVLYPHYLAPIPSMAITQFEPVEGTPPGHAIGRGTYLEAKAEGTSGEPCVYRTCYDVTLWPIDVEAVGIYGQPMPAPEVPGRGEAQGVVCISLKKRKGSDWTFSKLTSQCLRFFIKRPEQYVYAIYELLLNGPTQVVIAKAPNDPNAIVLGSDSLRPVGFSSNEALLPYDDRVFAGYRYLTEFFAFPQKFLFFEIGDLSEQALAGFGSELEIYVYTRTYNRQLQHSVTADTFALGCTPIVNLFEQFAEPIAVSHERYEYRVVPDRRRRHMELDFCGNKTASDTLHLYCVGNALRID